MVLSGVLFVNNLFGTKQDTRRALAGVSCRGGRWMIPGNGFPYKLATYVTLT